MANTDDSKRTITAYISINGKNFLGTNRNGKSRADTMVWSRTGLQKQIYAKIGVDVPITSIMVNNVTKTEGSLVEELFCLLASQKGVSQAGLKELVIQWWGIPEEATSDEMIGKKGDSGVFDAPAFAFLGSKCSSLTTLTVGCMKYASDSARMALAKLVATVLAKSTELKTVDLRRFSQA